MAAVVVEHKMFYFLSTIVLMNELTLILSTNLMPPTATKNLIESERKKNSHKNN